MILQRPITRAWHLRESYIEISRYIRVQLQQRRTASIHPSRRLTLCQRYSSTTTARDDAGEDLNEGRPPRFPGRDVKTTRTPNLSKEQYQSLARFERSNPNSLPSTDHPDDQNHVQIFGFLTSQRSIKGFDFLQLVDPRLELAVQVVLATATPAAPKDGQSGQQQRDDSDSKLESTKSENRDSLDTRLNVAESIKAHTPVQIVGSIVQRPAPSKKGAWSKPSVGSQDGSQQREEKHEATVRKLDPFVGMVDLISHVEIRAHSIKVLNSFPPDTIAQCDTAFPPELRHLQFRTDHDLRYRIRLRAKVSAKIREHMLRMGFDEIETPLLFKSTPEGAREFIVPTRKKGMAYALPQSPQQYKQVLMASGISRYFQLAKCFRDEDLRADRQPEFTQFDLEMSFAGGTQVMTAIENILVNSIWPNVPNIPPLCNPDLKGPSVIPNHSPGLNSWTFPQLTYETALSRYGSDKPDTRLGSEIHRIDDWLPGHVKGMLTSLDDPIVEMVKIDMQGCDPVESGRFIKSFLDAPSSHVYVRNVDGIPGVAVYDPKKPLTGLASFGYDGAARVEEHFHPRPGDIFIVQARPKARFVGGSTVLGNLRRDIYQAAISQELIPAPSGFSPLWVTDFPLFSPVQESEPGQGGLAGICSTHHPFTAPKQGQDLSMLVTSPLDVIGDHYDLVINGVEVGGGSRRIHTADMQEFVLREVLKMKPERVEDFRHLLNALKSGCPPHAGFALGFDRLMAMLTDRTSVRDVIAFPKYTDGQDKFVGSPSALTQGQLATYHLTFTDGPADNSFSPSPV
ncbi:aspartate-tRNA ligase [Rhinocladiella mackenziei CBS 650.93]|uniref:Aspartate-tRNA ligase n=1 Tax=Rhinocladiella mackenziei CBS 650.93 TaxID=1442369 RepID=A0A0D2H989_9EURO|nr:aspartate-tRNA ligase [Rhinocladiella mackenziei CBS 650.93]KIX07038.1 aspartate-tRNA ligase [Rhinocladiella mackenziei CBS 650.93]